MNLYDAGMPSEEERFDTLLERKNLRVERIVSWNHRTPLDSWYDQEEDEWVVLLEGTATLHYEDEDVFLKQGEPHLIPAHRRHQVAATSGPAIWLCIFCEAEEQK